MTRLLYTLSALGMTSGLVAVSSAPVASPARQVAVVGNERPMFLGSAVVTASALPESR